MKWPTRISCAFPVTLFAAGWEYTTRTVVASQDHYGATKRKKAQMQVIEFFRIGKVKIVEWEDEYIFEDWKVTCQVEGQAVDLDIHLEEVNDSSIATVNQILRDLEKIAELSQAALV